MKNKRHQLSHKSGSPVKRQRRRVLSSLTACVEQFTMNLQRTNPFHRSSRQDRRGEEENRSDRHSMPMEARTMEISSFHGQEYETQILPPYYHRQSPAAPENRFATHDQFGMRMPPHLPQTPNPRSWNLTSPPKPRRVSSTDLPFPVPQASAAYSYPVQARFVPRQSQVPRNINMSTMTFYHQCVGDPSLKIFRVKLPPHLFHILDEIVLGCEAHAATLPDGWITDLYSLTKQDIALRKIPHLYDAAKPIVSYIKRSILALFGARSLRMDKNQPHILKYSTEDGHTGVELHHDKCDVTANLCLSRSSSYVGGGTTFPAARQLVRLEIGEFLIHPGSLVHGGMNITSGTRHLMILFANLTGGK